MLEEDSDPKKGTDGTKQVGTSRQRNLPIVLIVRESVNRFLEVIGVRPEQLAKSQGLFGKSIGMSEKVHLDWTVEKPKSNLAIAFL